MGSLTLKRLSGRGDDIRMPCKARAVLGGKVESAIAVATKIRCRGLLVRCRVMFANELEKPPFNAEISLPRKFSVSFGIISASAMLKIGQAFLQKCQLFIQALVACGGVTGHQRSRAWNRIHWFYKVEGSQANRLRVYLIIFGSIIPVSARYCAYRSCKSPVAANASSSRLIAM